MSGERCDGFDAILDGIAFGLGNRTVSRPDYFGGSSLDREGSRHCRIEGFALLDQLANMLADVGGKLLRPVQADPIRDCIEPIHSIANAIRGAGQRHIIQRQFAKPFCERLQGFHNLADVRLPVIRKTGFRNGF